MSLQNFAWALFSTSLGTIISVSPKRNWKQFLRKILEGQQRVLWYFWKRPIASRQPVCYWQDSVTKDLNLEQIQLVVRMRIKSWIVSLMPWLLSLVVSLCIQGDLKDIIKNVLTCRKKCLKIFNNITHLKSILLKDEKHHLLHADAVPLFPK